MNEIEADLVAAMPLDIVEEESGEAEVIKVFQKGVNPGDKKEGLLAGCRIKRFEALYCLFHTCFSGYLSTEAEISIRRRGIQIYKTSAATLFYKGTYLLVRSFQNLFVADEIDYVDEGEFGFSADWSDRGFLPGDILKATTRESSRRDVEWNWS